MALSQSQREAQNLAFNQGVTRMAAFPEIHCGYLGKYTPETGIPEAVKESILDLHDSVPGLTYPQIGKLVGVSHMTVSNVIKADEADLEMNFGDSGADRELAVLKSSQPDRQYEDDPKAAVKYRGLPMRRREIYVPHP